MVYVAPKSDDCVKRGIKIRIWSEEAIIIHALSAEGVVIPMKRNIQ